MSTTLKQVRRGGSAVRATHSAEEFKVETPHTLAYDTIIDVVHWAIRQDPDIDLDELFEQARNTYEEEARQ